MKALLEKWGNLSPEQYSIEHIPVTPAFNDNVHTLQINNGKPNNLVMIHGFGGSGVIFYKYFKPLSEYYNIYAIDLRGAGLSGRSHIIESDVSKLETYYLDGVDKAIKSKIKGKFTLLGHSLGGYVAALYAHLHPDNIEKLYLLSPAGYSKLDPKKIDEFIDMFEHSSYTRKLAISCAVPFIAGELSPFLFLRYLGKSLAMKAINRYQNYINMDNKEEAHDYVSFLYQMNLQDPCSDMHIGKILTLQGCGKTPLEERVVFSMPIHFIYGEKDWMNTDGAYKTKNACKYITITIIPNVGHNLNIQAVDTIVAYITGDKKQISIEI